MSNQILVIHPYFSGGVWQFDDPALGLKGEPFVGNVNYMIDLMIARAKIKDAHKGFTALFSHEYIPGWQMRLMRWRAENGGVWYYDAASGLTGWLCPVVFKYFQDAPPQIFVRALPNPRKSWWQRLRDRMQ